MTNSETEPDWTAIELVALDGHRMKLNNTDRLEAIKIMAKNDVSRQMMAWRLYVTVDALERFARYNNVILPKTIKPAHWSVDYIGKSKRSSNSKPGRVDST